MKLSHLFLTFIGPFTLINIANANSLLLDASCKITCSVLNASHGTQAGALTTKRTSTFYLELEGNSRKLIDQKLNSTALKDFCQSNIRLEGAQEKLLVEAVDCLYFKH